MNKESKEKKLQKTVTANDEQSSIIKETGSNMEGEITVREETTSKETTVLKIEKDTKDTDETIIEDKILENKLVADGVIDSNPVINEKDIEEDYSPELVVASMLQEEGLLENKDIVKPQVTARLVTMTQDQLQQLIASVTANVKKELETERLTTVTRATGKIQNRAYEILEDPTLTNLTYKEIAAKISVEFSSRTTAGCIAWYISNATRYNRKPLHRSHS